MNSLVEHAFEGIKRQREEKTFQYLDPDSLSKMSNKDLALWQSQNSPGSAQCIWAEHERQIRLIRKHVGAMRFAAYIGILGTVVGALLTWVLPLIFSRS